jgi:hypothetical protein
MTTGVGEMPRRSRVGLILVAIAVALAVAVLLSQARAIVGLAGWAV